MPDALSLDPSRTALVLIDLQQAILQLPVVPHSAADVLSRATSLAQRVRDRGGLVVLVRVSFAADGADMVSRPTDAQPPKMNRTEGWDELAPELVPHGHVFITKHQWGAFYGTELDLQLRRRGIDTIVLGGIVTNIGVESTARDAFERNYSIVFAEDAMGALNPDMHAFAVNNIFPRLGRVRSTEEVLGGLG